VAPGHGPHVPTSNELRLDPMPPPADMHRILLVRHDKIGDLVLTWPAFYLLRSAFPEATIDVLVAPANASFTESCPYIDNVITDTDDDAAFVEKLVAGRYDTAVALHSPWRICKLFRAAKIPYTLGPEHGRYLYKDRTSAKYKKGEPCWRGNCMIIEHLVRRQGREIAAMPERLWDRSDRKPHWREFYGADGDRRLVFVHPGTGGSSDSLSIDAFADLLERIDRQSQLDFKVILTGAGAEREGAARLADQLTGAGLQAVPAPPLDDLATFAESLVAADLFIAGSTGPLHIAGLHNVPTAGFYAGRRSRPDIRWQTLASADRRLSFTPPIDGRKGRDMSRVDIPAAADEIAKFLDSHYLDPRTDA
jgi:ADP-heptose:LPS heptosyltransferase